jgi:hypothetical protein
VILYYISFNSTPEYLVPWYDRLLLPVQIIHQNENDDLFHFDGQLQVMNVHSLNETNDL